ncbi:Cysteine desulfurase, SufS subfamily [uncultured Candidatus Thioglobus sp.]|nr:Cysteine desulfurase, SufS subfamily [uncultured Candidatus Thioglobus sp.]
MDKISTLDIANIRADFPILQQQINNQTLAYLDNAATAQKPLAVISALQKYYQQDNANIHRGLHVLSERATANYENARKKIRDFINARLDQEIIFLRGTTEGINLIAQSYGRSNLQPGDEIIISQMEHHANIVPWQLLCEQTGAVLKVIPMDDTGTLVMESYESLLNTKTKIVSVTHISNVLGTINPVQEISRLAHAHGAVIIVDGAQAVSHMPVDVQALDCDFYVFSGHKVFAPTGIGVLYGKQSLLQDMPPWHGGGNMIKTVSFEKTVYNDLPDKFEAGTPDIAGAIGLGVAIDYINGIGTDKIANYEQELLEYAHTEIQKVPKLRLIGNAEHQASILSFTVDDFHPHDIGTILDHAGIAIRAGHHCAMPIMAYFNVPATARASFAFYNTIEEVDRLVQALTNMHKVLG